MWNRIKDVAEHRRLDPVEFLDFALLHRDRFGVAQLAGPDSDFEVSNWHVDALVEAFRKARLHASQEVQHGRYLDSGPAAWDDIGESEC